MLWSRRLVRYRIGGGRAFPGGHPPALKPPEPSQTIRSQPPLIEPDMKFSLIRLSDGLCFSGIHGHAHAELVPDKR
jgi:hypothetical protein